MYKNVYQNASEIVKKIREGRYETKAGATEDETVGLIPRRNRSMSVDSASESEYDPLATISKYLDMVKSEAPTELAVESSPRPVNRQTVLGTKDFAKTEDFQQALKEFKTKYPGVTEHELFQIIKKESSFNPAARNTQTDAAGLFQFIPVVAEELGYTTDEIRSMSAGDQLRLYGKYLERWDFDASKASLGLMQAAPAYRNADPNTVIYEVGSPEWKANPPWREGKDGPVTVQSINRFYKG